MYVSNFVSVEQLPWELRKMLKWKMSSITPNVVKKCIARANFRATKSKHSIFHLLTPRVHAIILFYIIS